MKPAPLRTALALALGLVACSESGPQTRFGVPPRHLLLITVEGLRADHVTSLGYDRRTTSLLRPDQPIVLDLGHIADTGVVFARGIAPAAAPSLGLAQLHAGGLPVAEGAPAPGQLPDGAGPLLAEDLAAAGLRTAAFVNATALPEDLQGPSRLVLGFEQATFAATDEATLGAAVGWLREEAPAGGAHFTWVHLAGLRAPFEGPPLRDRTSSEGASAEPALDLEQQRALMEGRGQVNGRVRRELVDLYDGRLVRLTELINSFFFLYKHEFGDEAFWDESLVVVAGVTGLELAEGGRYLARSSSLREESLRVPFLVRHPASLTGERLYDEPVDLADLGATLREWLGAPGYREAPGRSLLGLTDTEAGRSFEAGLPLSVLVDGSAASVTDGRWRLVARGERVRLHDLLVDPGQQQDVSEARPAVVERLLMELDLARARAGLIPRTLASSKR